MGSFLNALIYRLRSGEGIVFTRSHCPKCNHKLYFWDLVPVLSFVFLLGRCRYCEKKISWQYPLVEVATGTLFVLVFSKVGVTPALFLHLAVFSLLIVIFVYDLKHYIIPDRIIYPAIGLAFLYRGFQLANFRLQPLSCELSVASPGAFSPLFAGIFTAGFFFVIYLLSGGKWLGFGDVKFAFFMGLFLGFPTVMVALFLAVLIGSFVGSGLVLFGEKGWKSEIPFGPFLVSGTIIGFLWGGGILRAYFDIFLLV